MSSKFVQILKFVRNIVKKPYSLSINWSKTLKTRKMKTSIESMKTHLLFNFSLPL